MHDRERASCTNGAYHYLTWFEVAPVLSQEPMTQDSFRALVEMFQVSKLNEGYWAMDVLQLHVDLG